MGDNCMVRSLGKTAFGLIGVGLLWSLPAYADNFQFPDYYQSAFDYCAAVRNADYPDTRHVSGVLPDDALRQLGAKNPGFVTWRCMNAQVWACTTSANTRCDTKANAGGIPAVGSVDARGYPVSFWTLLNPSSTAAFQSVAVVPATPASEPVPSVQQPFPVASGSDTVSSNTNVAIVTAGDTLFSIARATGTSVEYLKQLNGLTSDTIFVGQQLFFR